MKRLIASFCFHAGLLSVACPTLSHASDVVLDWNLVMTSAHDASPWDFRDRVQTRAFAVAHIAMYRAVLAAQEDSAAKKAPPTIEAEVAAAVAAHDTLIAQLPGHRFEFDRVFAAQLETVPQGVARERGLALGREAASNVLARWPRENAAAKIADDAALRTRSSHVIAIVLPPPPRFRASPPYTVDDDGCHQTFSRMPAYDSILQRVSGTEAASTAQFWNEPPVLIWNRAARSLAASASADLLATARMFAILNTALADAGLAACESQAYFATRRTVTLRAEAVSASADSRNLRLDPIERFKAASPDTVRMGTFSGTIDMPLPPLINYPSVSAAENGAAAAVLREIFRGDARPVIVTTMTRSGGAATSREYRTFDEAAHEGALAAVLAEETFREAAIAGCEQGAEIGRWIFRRARSFTDGDARR